MIEAGEEPEGVARREAQEEAGCELGNLIPISQVLGIPWRKLRKNSSVLCLDR